MRKFDHDGHQYAVLWVNGWGFILMDNAQVSLQGLADTLGVDCSDVVRFLTGDGQNELRQKNFFSVSVKEELLQIRLVCLLGYAGAVWQEVHNKQNSKVRSVVA